MPAEIKFTAFGIPYLVEFANVSFKGLSSPPKSPKSTRSLKSSKILPKLPKRSATLSHCPTCGNHTPEKIRPLEVDFPEIEENSEQTAGGLFIQLPSRNPDVTPGKISPERLSRLRRTIAYAVTHAGMSTPTAEEKVDPLDKSSQDSGSRPQTPTSTAPHTLFKGTYGQVKTALRNAGLTATPCTETGYDYATRLGVLFVAKRKQSGGVEFQKLTLWG